MTLFALTLLAVTDLNGTWEVQSLGADRIVRLEQDGNELMVHRVLHPEFEGERYRLDHLYHGVLNGDAIEGELLVKEDELPDFEVLRKFAGTLKDGQLVIDGLTLVKVSLTPEKVAMLPVLPKRKRRVPRDRRRPSTRSGVKRGTTQQKVHRRPPQAPTTIAEGENRQDDAGAGLYESILGANTPMVQVSREVQVPADAESAMQRGIEAYKAQDYQTAFQTLSEARELHAPATIHRWLGLAAAKVEETDVALRELRRALRIDPQDQEAMRSYESLKASR